ncbi:DUF4403 family protein [Bacteroidota bacterium]
MKRWLQFLVIAGLLLVIGWQLGYFDRIANQFSRHREIRTTAPEPAPPPERSGKMLESMIHIPIEIPVSEITALVNRAVPDSLFHTRDMEVRGGILAVSLDLDIVRHGEIETYSAFGSIFNRVSLAARGRLRIPPGVWRPFESTFTINTTTDLLLDDEWNTQSLTYASMVWGDEPDISVAGINISLKGASENILDEQLAALTPEIDRIIEKEVDLRREVDKVWNDLIEPLLIREYPSMWLSIRPEQAFYMPPETRGDTVVVELWVSGLVETVVGESASAYPVQMLPPLHPLPDTLSAEAGQFTIHLPVSVSYNDAGSIIERALEDRRLSIQDGVDLELGNILLYGLGQSLVAQVDFTAILSETSVGTSGRVYFIGTPTYDSVEQVIRVDSLDYDLESRDALTEAADWFFKEEFLDEIRQQLVFSIGEEILFAREQLAEALRHRTVGKHILLLGTIEHLTAGDIFLVDGGINVDIFATGRLEARIRKLEAAIKEVPRVLK